MCGWTNSIGTSSSELRCESWCCLIFWSIVRWVIVWWPWWWEWQTWRFAPSCSPVGYLTRSLPILALTGSTCSRWLHPSLHLSPLQTALQQAPRANPAESCRTELGLAAFQRRFWRCPGSSPQEAGSTPLFAESWLDPIAVIASLPWGFEWSH